MHYVPDEDDDKAQFLKTGFMYNASTRCDDKQFLMHHASTGGDDKAQLLRTAVRHYVSTGGDNQMQSFMQYVSNGVDGKVALHYVSIKGDDKAQFVQLLSCVTIRLETTIKRSL